MVALLMTRIYFFFISYERDPLKLKNIKLFVQALISFMIIFHT